jgi:serine phosphatase RsbU (regulator of sigma subunit)
MAHTILGKFNRAFYLSASKHYKEAADVFQQMDNVLAMYSPSISLDWIHEYYLPKFEANLHAGRRDSAFVQAEQICETLDSTLTTYMHDEGGKLATIYASLKKEEKIIEQEERIIKQRTLGFTTLILLLGGFFGTYTVRSRRHARRLAEVRAEQERIENELSIAREIQMSMVPHNFPKHSGLDMYALMEPAKEVGGDLYGYVFNKNKLYFAVGDVSGKGIPASLFMAQVTRLFHTLADEGLMPNQICTIMNKELSGEDNVNGMFVTMFIGMLDIESGHVDFCNAGHNPPIINCGESNAKFLEVESNAPIGLWPDLEYVGEEIDDIKDRTLLVYSDGLNEAENLEQKQFGDDHLMDILSTSQFASSQHLISRLQTEVEKHRNGAAPNDDLTMFCLRMS